MYNILILCTANSARSIIGEVLINHLGGTRFRGFSAGSTPSGTINPHALAMLRDKNLPTINLHSKSWDKFTWPNAPKMDLVITVCDNAAGETCPVWPGSPTKAHWGLPDPAATKGTDEEIRRAFEQTYQQLETRLTALFALNPDKASPQDLQSAVSTKEFTGFQQ